MQLRGCLQGLKRFAVSNKRTNPYWSSYSVTLRRPIRRFMDVVYHTIPIWLHNWGKNIRCMQRVYL